MSRIGGIERGDFFRVIAGPQRGEWGTVMRVMRFPGESESAAMFLIRFSDGSEGH